MSDDRPSQRAPLFSWSYFLRHSASTLAQIGVLAVAAQVIIVGFGGRVPPWPLDNVIRMMINDAITKHELQDNARWCADFNSRYVRAALVLRQMPTDPAAQLQYSDNSNEIDQIPNCKKAMLP
jgi:hypothetical protein